MADSLVPHLLLDIALAIKHILFCRAYKMLALNLRYPADA